MSSIEGRKAVFYIGSAWTPSRDYSGRVPPQAPDPPECRCTRWHAGGAVYERERDGRARPPAGPKRVEKRLPRDRRPAWFPRFQGEYPASSNRSTRRCATPTMLSYSPTTRRATASSARSKWTWWPQRRTAAHHRRKRQADEVRGDRQDGLHGAARGRIAARLRLSPAPDRDI